MQVFRFFKAQSSSVMDLVSNTSWLLSAELIAKVSRIFTLVILAAKLSPTAYGTAMLALAFHDVFGLLLRAGVGSQVINCKKEQLADFARNGVVIQWAICLFIAMTQFTSANYLASIYNNHDVALLLQIMVVIYLLYPWVSIRIFLLHRANKMRWFSVRNGLCVIIENCTIAISALLGADILAVAFGKIAFSLFWVLLFSFSPVKSYGAAFKLSVVRLMLKTSGKLFNIEFLRAIRIHADTFIAGKLLTPELFGFYTFAKNAGVGLSQSIIHVFISGLYPYLCKLQRAGQLLAEQRKILLIAFAFALIFVAQALVAPIYVPLIFDDKWLVTIPIISILCLAALPNFIIDILCCFQRATEQYYSETLMRFTCLMIFLSSLLLVQPTDAMGFALLILCSSVCCLLVIYFIHFKQQPNNHFTKILNRRSPHES